MNNKKTASTKTTRKPWKRALIITLGILGFLVVLVALSLYWLTHNYAQDEARQWESALIAEGGVKECTGGDPGRGPDNSSPWYVTEFVLPGDRATATALVQKAATKAGLSLVDKTDPNPQYDQFYFGSYSRKSTHRDLEDGYVNFSVLVYKTWAFVAPADKTYCTITKQQSPITNKTTILISVGLPEFKR